MINNTCHASHLNSAPGRVFAFYAEVKLLVASFTEPVRTFGGDVAGNVIIFIVSNYLQ